MVVLSKIFSNPSFDGIYHVPFEPIEDFRRRAKEIYGEIEPAFTISLSVFNGLLSLSEREGVCFFR